MTSEIIIVTEAEGSGLGRFASELSAALSQASVNVVFVAPPQPQEPVVSDRILLLSGREKTGNKYVNLIAAAVASGRHVLKLARPGRPLLVVQLSPTFPASAAPILAAKLRGAPCILNLHDFYQQTLRFPRPLQGLERLLYRIVYRLFDLFVTTTGAQRERLIKEVGIPPEHILIMPHPVFEYAGISPPADETQEFTFLVFGSLRRNKMIRQSIEAVAALRARNVPVKLRIAGAPPRAHRAYWEECRILLASLDPAGFEVEDHYLKEADIPRVLSGVDAVLCPYEEFDSQSGVAMTALSNGLPLVATRAGGLNEAHLMAGAWTEIDTPVDTNAIATALERFLATPRATHQAEALRAQEHILRELSWVTTAQTLLEAFSRLNVGTERPPVVRSNLS